MTQASAGVRIESSLHEGRDMTLVWVLAVLMRERRILTAFAVTGMVLALAAGLLRRASYTATFSFVPLTQQDPSRAGLAGLAGQFGISLGSPGGSQSPQLYADMLSTRAILGPVARDSIDVMEGSARTPVSQLLGISGSDPAVVEERVVRDLRTEVVKTAFNRTTGMVSVSVRTRDARLSLAIARRVLQELNTFNVVSRQSQARDERQFTEERLAAARGALREAEFAYLRFLQSNMQFDRSPNLVFARDTLQRVVTLQMQVVNALAQQYEEVRMREVRDTPIITVIEPPALPARRNPRQLGLLLIAALLASLGAGTLVVLAREAWWRDGTATGDPAFAVLAGEWSRIRGKSA